MLQGKDTSRRGRPPAEGGDSCLRDGQVHPDTHPVPMGNYVIRVGNYVTANAPSLGNSVIVDTESQGE
jgi:hypothetical protein